MPVPSTMSLGLGDPASVQAATMRSMPRPHVSISPERKKTLAIAGLKGARGVLRAAFSPSRHQGTRTDSKCARCAARRRRHSRSRRSSGETHPAKSPSIPYAGFLSYGVFLDDGFDDGLGPGPYARGQSQLRICGAHLPFCVIRRQPCIARKSRFLTRSGP